MASFGGFTGTTGAELYDYIAGLASSNGNAGPNVFYTAIDNAAQSEKLASSGFNMLDASPALNFLCLAPFVRATDRRFL